MSSKYVTPSLGNELAVTITSLRPVTKFSTKHGCAGTQTREDNQKCLIRATPGKKILQVEAHFSTTLVWVTVETSEHVWYCYGRTSQWCCSPDYILVRIQTVVNFRPMHLSGEMRQYHTADLWKPIIVASSQAWRIFSMIKVMGWVAFEVSLLQR